MFVSIHSRSIVAPIRIFAKVKVTIRSAVCFYVVSLVVISSFLIIIFFFSSCIFGLMMIVY